MKKAILMILFLLICMCFLGTTGIAMAENSARSSDAELAQELTNPVADLITIPVQMTWDHNIGVRDDGWRLQTNFQPVIPFNLNDNWNLITRTILPVIYQDDISPGAGSQFGLGDLSVSLFFEPKNFSKENVIFSFGPMLVLPTATDKLLGTKKWSAGPAMLTLTMQGPWTIGMLANHMWSYAGDSDRADVNNTFFQPFVAFTTPDAYTYAAQIESNYDWNTEKWTIPITANVSKLVRWGKLPVSLSVGVGYWAKSQANSPEGFRFRFQMNFVLPKSIFSKG